MPTMSLNRLSRHGAVCCSTVLRRQFRWWRWAQRYRWLSLVLALLLSVGPSPNLSSGQSTSELPPLSVGDDGRLTYHADPRNNRIPDFSSCGYAGSDYPIPTVPATILVRPTGGDDTRLLQAALDHVAQLPLQPDNLRGAVLLDRGEFRIEGQLRMRASGVVLRGCGATPSGTTLRGSGIDRRPLILVSGNASELQPGPGHAVVDEYVPLGAYQITLGNVDGLSQGDTVLIQCPSSTTWIRELGMDRLGWRAGSRDIRWLRGIRSIDQDTITLDAALTTAIQQRHGGATLRKVVRNHHVENVGIEDLRLVSDFNRHKPHDEDHAWYGVTMNHVTDAWVRRVEFQHFAGGAVLLSHDTSRVTIEDCAMRAPVSEVGGHRRETYFTQGQQTLFLRCWSEDGRHDFVVGHCAAGPNVFVNCSAHRALDASGPRQSWAAGVLFDNVRIDGADLALANRWNAPTQAGWTAANCVLWQCQAAGIRCERPPGANNWVLGYWARAAGSGTFLGESEFVNPLSLFQQQLRERVGDQAAERVGPFLLDPQGATNPSVAQASAFVAGSQQPARQLLDVIRQRWQKGASESTSATAQANIPSFAQQAPPASASRRQELRIVNGWLATEDRVMTGGHYTPQWWRGSLQPDQLERFGHAITRFVPGLCGVGLTDDLPAVAAKFVGERIVGYDHHYGLWYDRRRDDHLMTRRADGKVEAPFYEQPFARSGRGRAWDGLSRYDLTQFNPWYWKRLADFANLCDEHGLVLFHHHYFQHNLLEAGAHWADSPWRPANNVNRTLFPEPPPYIGDKRIFLAEKFYDMDQPAMRQLHRSYIRQCLDNFQDHTNVIQLTSGEYSGPLAFVEFWIDTIIDWQREKGQHVLVALSCPKDVQDAILSDTRRAEQVDVIDIRYWTYTEDDGLYAPPGGQNLSPRQHLRQLKPAGTSFASIVRAVREYRQRFPAKAVTYYADLYCRSKRDGWAVLMGGGSLADIPELPSELEGSVLTMLPADDIKLADQQWCLANTERSEMLIYSHHAEPTRIELPDQHSYEFVRLKASNGKIVGNFTPATAQEITLHPGTEVVWVRANDADRP